MMPFSVLRVFGLLLFIWLLLGLGVYLSYESYRHFAAQPLVVDFIPTADFSEAPGEQVRSLEAESSVSEPQDGTSNVTQPSQVAVSESIEWEPWAVLAGAVLCLGWSFGGRWPTAWLLGNSNGKPLVQVEPSSIYSIDRPDGSQLHVNAFGNAAGPTLIMTHGWTLNSSAWNYLIGDLVKQFRIVTWDLPGLGESRGPTRGGFSMEMLAEHLEAVVKSAIVEGPTGKGPAILVGHSIGGMTQQTFCRLFPQHLGNLVTGMVLVHTTYTNPVRTNFAAALTTAIETPVLIPLNYLMIALSPLAWLSNWQSYMNGSSHWTTRFTSFTGRQTREQLDHSARMGVSAWPATAARGNLAMLGFDSKETLPKVHIPVLVIGGENDRMTICAASDQISQLLPNDRPVRIKGGHLGYWEDADEVIAAVQAFALQQFNSPQQLSSANRSGINGKDMMTDKPSGVGQAHLTN